MKNDIAETAILTAAITGAIHTPSMSRYLPITVDQIIDGILAVHEAGGAVAHFHVREESTGYPNADQETFQKIAQSV